MRYLFLGFIGLFFLSSYAQPIPVVAAENMYGTVAQEIGGDSVSVTSILHNPNQDPHLFSASPNTAKAIARAQIIVYNGLDYDPWMQKLIASATHSHPIVLNVGEKLGYAEGSNPHIWYDPTVMPRYAMVLTQQLIRLDPAHQADYQRRLQAFLSRMKPYQALIEKARRQLHGTPVIATEPVFGYLSDALGFSMAGTHFQLSIMNDAPPSAQDTADFENRLRQHQVKLLIYNNQVTNPITERLKRLAMDSGIAVIGVSETQPSDQTYVQWMQSQLNAILAVLLPLQQVVHG